MHILYHKALNSEKMRDHFGNRNIHTQKKDVQLWFPHKEKLQEMVVKSLAFQSGFPELSD